MNAPAKFLVLLDAARPALLIDSDKHLLGEVIEDDGFIVDSLLLNAKVCADPRTDMLGAVVPPPLPGFGAALLPVALIAKRRPDHDHPTGRQSQCAIRTAGASRSGARAALR